MANPMILIAVADATMRDALTRELDHRFGADYRVIAVDTATQGLATLDAERVAGGEVAIVLAAGEWPAMTAIDFLDLADDRYPTAQRGLLVASGPAGMTEPIRRAMLFNHLDFQIVAPWVSPEEWLYPTVSEALRIWTRQHRPRAESITIIDRAWDARGHDLRDLLERSGVSYGFYAVDSAPGRSLMTSHGLAGERLPVVIHASGTVLADPSNEEVARALGVATEPPTEPVDVTIIGTGPAGLAAAVYGASEGLRPVVIEAGALGGQAATTNQILNYLGFPRGLSGPELTTRAFYQAMLFGTRFVFTRRVDSLRPGAGAHHLTFDNGAELSSKAVVVACGVAARPLGVPALADLAGRGVYYGATGAEAAALAGEEVYVVGGGNAAGQATLDLARHAARVTLVIRGDGLAPGMSDYLIQQIAEAPNVTVCPNTRVVDGVGERRLRGLVLERGNGNGNGRGPDVERERVPATALFVEIGGEPHTDWLPVTLARDERGHLLTGRELWTAPTSAADQGTTPWPLARPPLPLETSLPGVFAAGDVRSGAVGRVAAAAGDGALAIRSVHEYLQAQAATAAPRATPSASAPGAKAG